MKTKGIPVGRKERSTSEDIIAGVDFLSVFIRNAEERYYPDFNPKTTLPYDIIDPIYQQETTTKRPRFSVSTTKLTTTTTPTTTTRKPKLKIPTLPTIRKVELPTSESPSNVELRTALPPITNSEVYKYIRSKIKPEKPDKYNKQDVFTEVSVVIATEKNSQNSKNSISFIEPSAINSNTNREELNIEESEPLTIDATEINEEIVTRNGEKVLIGANPDYIAQQHSRINREDQSSYHYDFNRNGRLSQNVARSISYSAVIQVPHQDTSKEWKQNENIEPRNDQNIYNNYRSSDYQDYKLPERKNITSSAAETKEYYVTRKFSPQQNPNKSNIKVGDTWDQKQVENQQHKLYHTTERIWGMTEKNWGVQQTTPKVWGTTEKNWGIQEKPFIPSTPKVWGTTEKVWGTQSQPTPSTLKVWGTTEKNWGLPENQYPNRIYSQPEDNYEVDEAVSVLTNGREHGVQNNKENFEKPLQLKGDISPVKATDSQKVGYVVEGRNFKKYRVEERTSDGFIVGEYGVVSNDDGSLRGVRYTADGTINPSVIYDALLKFLSL